MRLPQFKRYLIISSMAGAMLLTFAYHVRYAEAPISMDDLMRVGAVVPCAASQNAARAITKAVSQEFNYLNQLFLYTLCKGGTSYRIVRTRVWDGVAAALAVLWLYRVGSMCCSRFTGVIGAFLLALSAPHLWGRHALGIFVVLLHWELFLFAVNKDTLTRWVLWCMVSVLLFCTGVFAEPVLLQTWFLALLAAWVVWFYGTRFLREWDAFRAKPHKGHHRKDRSLWNRVREDAGFSRFAATIIFVAVIMTLLGVIGGVFVSRFAVSIENLALMFFAVLGLIFVASVVLLALPIFSRERSIILDWFLGRHMERVMPQPVDIFVRPEGNTILHMCLSYSGAILLFLPLFYIFRDHVNIFIDNWEFGRTIAFINSSGSLYYWVLLSLPLACWLITCAGYVLHILPRARLISVTCLLILGSVYIFQQRYAVFSTPFYVLCAAGVVSTVLETATALALRPFVKSEAA